MTDERWQKVADLFGAALDQPSERRAEFVRRHAAADTDLRDQVESLLASDGQSMLLDESLPAHSLDLLVDNPHVRRGDMIGPYQIDSLLGVGGMGEVCRARDTRLNRNVAIKILPPAFAADPERIARFKREAQVLASLNHPNIANIYGLEQADGVLGLVLELVEGPTLAEMLESRTAAAGRAVGLPVEEAMRIAQIADALENAHEQGIVHRDLKPANNQGPRRWHREGAGFRTREGR